MNQLRERKRPGAVRGLRSVQLGVVDLDHALDFFTRIWGLSPVSTKNGSAWLRATGADHHAIALHRRPRTEALRIDLRASEPADVDAIHARLAGRGVAELTKPAALREEGGGYGFTVRDPDGRLLLILSDDATHADVADTIDRPRKLSHVVLNTAEAARLETFYIEGLGFRLVDRTRRMSFINC